MKKTLLGVLALTSVASFANVTGYVKSNSEATVKTDDVKANPVAYEYGLSTKLDLGLFLDDKKDTFVFAGGELKGKAVKGSLEKPGYLGVRFDGAVTENTNLTLTGIYRLNKDANTKDTIIEHLKAKKVWDDKASDDDKKALLRKEGYRFNNDDETLLISAILKGKYDEINYRLGGIYVTDNFKEGTHGLESFVEVDAKLEKVNVEGKLTHEIGRIKKLVENPANQDYYFNRVELIEVENSNSLKNAGRLKGEVKVSTDKLANRLALSTKAKFDLGTVLPEENNFLPAPEFEKIEAQHYFKVASENEAKYEVIKGLELEGKLNYNAEVSNLPIKDGEAMQFDAKIENNYGFMLHRPEIVLGAKYTKDNLTVATTNSNQVVLNTYLGKWTYNDKVLRKLYTLNNEFISKNNLDYKFNDNINLSGLVQFKNEVGFNVSSEEIKPISYLNNVLITPTLKVNNEHEGLKYDGEYRLGYIFDRYSTGYIAEDGTNVNTSRTYNIALTKLNTKLDYSLTSNIKLNAALDLIGVYANINDTSKTKDASLMYSTNVFSGVLNPKVGLTYEKENVKFVTTLATDVYAQHVRANAKDEEKDILLNKETAHMTGENTETDLAVKVYKKTGYFAKTTLDNKLTYGITSNVALFSEFNLAHSLQVNTEMREKGLEKYRDRVKDNFMKDGLVNLNANILKDEEQKEALAEFPSTSKHMFKVMPALGVTAKFIDNKLTVEPKISATAKYLSNVRTENEKSVEELKFKSIEGKATLKVEYVW